MGTEDTGLWSAAATPGSSPGHVAVDDVFECDRPFIWSTRSSRAWPPIKGQSAHWRRRAAEHGVGYCLFIPVAARLQGLDTIALTRGDEPDQSSETGFLVMGARAVYTQFKLRPPNQPALAAPLTRRETEIARWLAAGKSDWEIGQILRISAKTSNYHVENIKKKCGVATRAQAVHILFCDDWRD